MDSQDLKWYFNPKSGEVSQGPDGGWDERMGPYETREEAASALSKAAERTKAADAYDEKDDEWGVAPKWN